MITLSVTNLKTKKSEILVYASKDKAEVMLKKLVTDPKEKASNKGIYLDGYSFDTKSEKALIEQYLPESRTGGD